jgi:glycosyltransferase involved in cell wall biosynthesis
MSLVINRPNIVKPPTVLVVHNQYRHRGGEDVVVHAEIDLLRSIGATVETFIYDSRDSMQMRRLKSRPDRLIFNQDVYKQIRRLIRRQNIEIVHCHNLVPLLSTSVYSAAAADGVPVVQTVHNYRIGCLNGLHLREGRICEQCRPGQYAAGIAFGCYRESRAQSLAFGLTQMINYWRGAWHQPTIYIALGRFLREKLMSWGIPAEKIVVKPHFVPYDPGPPVAVRQHALFVGRISVEKGLDLLLDVWSPDSIPLVIAGDGPSRARLEQRALREQKSNVRFVGHQDQNGISQLMKHAQFLVMPSVWYETFGLVLIEAYAHGVPVIATNMGAMADVVRHGVTGLLFGINDRTDLAAKIADLEHDPIKAAAMSAAARREYETLYTAETNADLLSALYARAIELSGSFRSNLITTTSSRGY